MGNVEAKELICMTQGHELRRGRRGWEGGGGVQGRGELRGDNCNSILNKIYLKIKSPRTGKINQ